MKRVYCLRGINWDWMYPAAFSTKEAAHDYLKENFFECSPECNPWEKDVWEQPLTGYRVCVYCLRVL